MGGLQGLVETHKNWFTLQEMNSNCLETVFRIVFMVLPSFNSASFQLGSTKQLCNLPEEKERAIMKQPRDILPRPISFRSKPPRAAKEGRKRRKRDFFSFANFSHKHVSTMLAINFLALALKANREKKLLQTLAEMWNEKEGFFFSCEEWMNIYLTNKGSWSFLKNSSYPSFWWH